MSEYREALQAIVNRISDMPSGNLDQWEEFHAAKALLARPEPELPATLQAVRMAINAFDGNEQRTLEEIGETVRFALDPAAAEKARDEDFYNLMEDNQKLGAEVYRLREAMEQLKKGITAADFIDRLDGRSEMLLIEEKAHLLAIKNDERRRAKLSSKQLMMEPEQFLAFANYCRSLEPAAAEKARELFTLDEWTEKDGDVLWWKFPIEEAPYVGSPLDIEWNAEPFKDCYTHWTRIPVPSPPAATGDKL